MSEEKKEEREGLKETHLWNKFAFTLFSFLGPKAYIIMRPSFRERIRYKPNIHQNEKINIIPLTNNMNVEKFRKITVFFNSFYS